MQWSDCYMHNQQSRQVHDSQCTEQGGVYEKLEDQFQRTGGKGVVDSAFRRGRYPFLIKSCQTLPTNATQRVVLVNNDATSLCHSSEWGMRGLQASFPRLRDRFMYEEYGECLLILLTLVHLFLLYSFCWLESNLIGLSTSIRRKCCKCNSRLGFQLVTCQYYLSYATSK
jgi:hypothetical protein